MSGLPNCRILFLFLVFVSLKAGILSAQDPPDIVRPLLNPEPYREQAGDDAETKLLKERVRHAQETTKYLVGRWRSGVVDPSYVFASLSNLSESQIEFHTDSRDKVDVLTHHLAFAKDGERVAKAKFVSGNAYRDEVSKAGYYRATIELRLLQAKKALPKDPGSRSVDPAGR